MLRFGHHPCGERVSASALANPQATYACINYGEAHALAQIKDRSILINADIDAVFSELLEICASLDGLQVL